MAPCSSQSGSGDRLCCSSGGMGVGEIQQDRALATKLNQAATLAAGLGGTLEVRQEGDGFVAKIVVPKRTRAVTGRGPSAADAITALDDEWHRIARGREQNTDRPDRGR